jgi:hypothetical protein
MDIVKLILDFFFQFLPAFGTELLVGITLSSLTYLFTRWRCNAKFKKMMNQYANTMDKHVDKIPDSSRLRRMRDAEILVIVQNIVDTRNEFRARLKRIDENLNDQIDRLQEQLAMLAHVRSSEERMERIGSVRHYVSSFRDVWPNKATLIRSATGGLLGDFRSVEQR